MELEQIFKEEVDELSDKHGSKEIEWLDLSCRHEVRLILLETESELCVFI